MNVDDAFVAMGWTLHLPSGTLSLVRSLALSLSSQNSQVRRNRCYCAVCQCVVDALIIPRTCLMLRKHSDVFLDSFLFWYSWYDSVGGLYWQLLTWCSYPGSGKQTSLLPPQRFFFYFFIWLKASSFFFFFFINPTQIAPPLHQFSAVCCRWRRVMVLFLSLWL